MFAEAFRQVPITSKEWALFALRWAAPVGLIIYLINLLTSAPRPELSSLALAGGVLLIAIVSNLFVLLLFISDRWLWILTPVTIVADVLLSAASVAATNITLGWIGIVPAVTAGFYFGWTYGLAAGAATAVGIVAVQLAFPAPGGPNVAIMALVALAVPGAGPLVAFLSSARAEVDEIKKHSETRTRRTEQITRMATEYMRVVYEMTEVLSASKLDPKSVLMAAVRFSVEALERVGTEPPIYTAMFLFASAEDGVGNVLRIVRGSDNFPASDLRVAAPGAAGAIHDTLLKQQATLCHTPSEDPEINRFTSFSKCGTVLCVPLGSGREMYGMMIIGAPEQDAFREMHVELMRAVANQAAASLNNTRLYGSLVQQRDRLVEIEKDARAQLASELHDGPTQGVAAITMRLNYIRKLIEKKPESAVEELFKIEDLARKTTKEIRHMLFELRPMALDQGLFAGLEQLAIKMQETYEQKVVIEMAPGTDQLLDRQATQILFSIATETVNNARKHAKASQITVQLAPRDDMLIFEVSDNGAGFDVEAALAAARSREGHLGLINLQERARVVEAALDLWSQPGQGSRTTVAMPLEVLKHRKEVEAEGGEGIVIVEAPPKAQ